jgi:hypothetical protein
LLDLPKGESGTVFFSGGFSGFFSGFGSTIFGSWIFGVAGFASARRVRVGGAAAGIFANWMLTIRAAWGGVACSAA